MWAHWRRLVGPDGKQQHTQHINTMNTQHINTAARLSFAPVRFLALILTYAVTILAQTLTLLLKTLLAIGEAIAFIIGVAAKMGLVFGVVALLVLLVAGVFCGPFILAYLLQS